MHHLQYVEGTANLHQSSWNTWEAENEYKKL